jgi:hypothetical protein
MSDILLMLGIFLSVASLYLGFMTNNAWVIVSSVIGTLTGIVLIIYYLRGEI